jgi:hypothetical protein
MVNVHYLYDIGDEAYTRDINKYYDTTATQACSKLKEGDGAFVYIPPSSWIYAIVTVATTEHTSRPPTEEPYIIFQTTRDGSTERIDRGSWVTRVRPLPKDHSSSHYTGTARIKYRMKIEKDDEDNNINLHSITAMPLYANRSFEELRLEDYMAGNSNNIRMQQIINNTSDRWGGSDINTFLEVDLGTERIILKRPVASSMYTKHQCLHIINTTTVKSSKERGQLINILACNKLVPNATSLYKLLLRDEEGKSISDDNWGIQLPTQQQQPIDMIHWYSRSNLHDLPYLPCPKKKRTLIEDAFIIRGEHVRMNIMHEKGWKGRI